MASPAQGSSTPQWQQPPTKLNTGGEIRSVTPAMNNTRGAGRHPSYPSRVPSPTPGSQYAGRMPSPQRYYHGQNGFDVVNPNAKGSAAGGTGTATGIPNNGATLQQQQHQQQQIPQGPSSTGLIRLTLRKPMGIVFEPMYDPNQPSVQRGVRICDLPRTGAAALSRRLEIGDELLSINDKTMSRLTFDEIMDFIIEADPEQVNLLFRRPRKEVLAARNAIHHGALAAVAASGPGPKSTPTSVKWVDEDSKKAAAAANDKSSSKKASKKESSLSSRKKNSSSRAKSDDDTLETYDEDSRRGSSRKKSRSSSKRDPYENESFLDLLIDTICANPDAVCKTRGRGDEEYYSDEDDRTLTSYDDSTYVTYESEKQEKKKSSKDSASVKKRTQKAFDSETEEDTDDDRRRSSKKDAKNNLMDTKPAPSGKYEDDQTLETIETRDRPLPPPITASPSPLGLAVVQEIEHAPPVPLIVKDIPAPVLPAPMPGPAVGGGEDKNKAPIAELEYDDLIDHAADVSVMESLGGPSLLIEKQRQAAFLSKTNNTVPAEIINEFGSDYPAAYGMTREQTIHRDPIKFYSFVVKLLLEQHEPEKVRLLDKLLAKYKGREDHLVQKLSVRYKRGGDGADENAAFGDFTDAVNNKKESPDTEVAVQKAQERAAAATFGKWPDKETKEAEPVDLQHQQQDEESDNESEFSGDSIDGTSPAVIAQVSELLNYVYGKTSVPGQIDRVSTIMRAYEGREAVLLELLETKALIKANSEKENAANLPSFLRNSPALHGNGEAVGDEADLVSPLSSPHVQNQQNQQQQGVGGNIINDDVSSMSGVSSPAPENGRPGEPPSLSKSKTSKEQGNMMKEPRKSSNPTGAKVAADAAVSAPSRNEKKKKGFLGGLFGKKNKKDKTRIRKGGKGDGEGSI